MLTPGSTRLAPAGHQVADVHSIEAAKLHRLDLADARIVQCSWCDARSFTDPCAFCAGRFPEAGFEDGATS